MNQRARRNTMLLLVLGFSLVLVGAGIFLLSQANLAPEDSAADATQCRKLGMNFAVPAGSVTQNGVGNYERMAKFGMGYSLDITSGDDQGSLDAVVASMQGAFQYGVTPILRVCVGKDPASCAFADPNRYKGFVDALVDRLGPSAPPFYLIAGPNEPLTEPWTGGAEGDPNTVGPPLAAYMNSLIDLLKPGQDTGRYRMISPAFNISDPGNGPLISIMTQNGARWNDLYGVTGNTYNDAHNVISNYVGAFIGQLGGIDKPIILTEVGRFDSRPVEQGGNGASMEAGLANLKRELGILRSSYPRVETYMLFNGFGLNPDSNFTYNVFTDAELADLAGPTCTNGTVPTPTPAGPTPTPLTRQECPYVATRIELAPRLRAGNVYEAGQGDGARAGKDVHNRIKLLAYQCTAQQRAACTNLAKEIRLRVRSMHDGSEYDKTVSVEDTATTETTIGLGQLTVGKYRAAVTSNIYQNGQGETATPCRETIDFEVFTVYPGPAPTTSPTATPQITPTPAPTSTSTPRPTNTGGGATSTPRPTATATPFIPVLPETDGEGEVLLFMVSGLALVCVGIALRRRYSPL